MDCTRKYPMHKLTHTDLDAFKTAFLAEQLPAGTVKQMMNDVFLKFDGNQSLDEMFKASLTFERKNAAEAFDLCRDSTPPSFLLALLRAIKQKIVHNEESPFTIALGKLSDLFQATECVCIKSAHKIDGTLPSNHIEPEEYLTAGDVELLRTYLRQLDLVDTLDTESVLMHFMKNKSAMDHFAGYKKLLDIITMSGRHKYFGNDKTFGNLLAMKVQLGHLDVNVLEALFNE